MHEAKSPEPYDADDIADLPAPVRRYFETVLQAGQPHVEKVRLDQKGDSVLVTPMLPVAWETADGEVPYWRGTITEIDYQSG